MRYIAYPFIISLLLLFSQGVASAANATDNCKPVYGGSQACEPTASISIDKKIVNPINNHAIDNLTVNDTKLRPGQDVRFIITVKNTGATTLSHIELTDSLPTFLVYTGGSVQFRQEGQVIRYTIDKLAPSESKTYEVRTRVVDVTRLPADLAVICPSHHHGTVNNAHVVIANKKAEDRATFCIDKGITVKPTVVPGKDAVITVPGKDATIITPGKGGEVVIPPTTKGGKPVYEAPTTEKAPNTGPELLGLIGLLPAGLAGSYLRRKSK